MNRTLRSIAVLAGALVAAAIASLLVYRALERVSRPAAVPMTTVVIAARDVPAGTMLTSDDVKAVAWPANTKLATSFAKVDEVAGRGTIDILRENEPLTAGKLAAKGAGAGLQPTIPAGMRAISIHVNEIIGVAGFVTPGSRVDVGSTSSGFRRVRLIFPSFCASATRSASSGVTMSVTTELGIGLPSSRALSWS